MQSAELNYDIYDKEMLAIILSLGEWRAELEGLQHTPFLIYSDHRSLEYFMIMKKLSAQQARWAEYLSRYHFKLSYSSGKSNERADTLTRRPDDVASQSRVMDAYCIQVLLPRDKIADEVIKDLQLAPIQATSLYSIGNSLDSIELVDRLLVANRAAPELEELRVKACTEADTLWKLWDGLLL
jgi:RNase H-like domain found in reverse transcriptase